MYSSTPALNEGNALIYDPKEKVDIFNKYFTSQTSLDGSSSLEPPRLAPFTAETISSLQFSEQNVRNL